jgi:hypothetical protein
MPGAWYTEIPPIRSMVTMNTEQYHLDISGICESEKEEGIGEFIMDSFVRVNIDCYYDHTHTKLGTHSGRTQISYSKCGLFAKSKLMKWKKILHCL